MSVSSKSVGLVDPRALSIFLAEFVSEAYEVRITDSDIEIMTKSRLIEYANNLLSSCIDDENLPGPFLKIASAGGIQSAEDAIEIIQWSGDEISRLIIAK